MISIKVKWSKRLAFDLPSKPAILERMARETADKVRARVRAGTDADGRTIPLVSDQTAVVSPDDPRFRDVSGLQPRKRKGSKGKDPDFLVYPAGYRSLKRAAGGGPTRGSDLGGSMWRHLAASVSQARGGAYAIKLYWADSEVVGYDLTRRTKTGKPKPIRVLTWQKALGAMFKRKSADGSPTGMPEFYILALTDQELSDIRDSYLRKVQLFKDA